MLKTQNDMVVWMSTTAKAVLQKMAAKEQEPEPEPIEYMEREEIIEALAKAMIADNFQYMKDRKGTFSFAVRGKAVQADFLPDYVWTFTLGACQQVAYRELFSAIAFVVASKGSNFNFLKSSDKIYLEEQKTENRPVKRSNRGQSRAKKEGGLTNDTKRKEFLDRSSEWEVNDHGRHQTEVNGLVIEADHSGKRTVFFLNGVKTTKAAVIESMRKRK